MISKFHVLYVGQIELDNIGLNGTPANDRRYSDERLREVFATAKDVAQTMDDLGFDVLWMAEHHFQREGYEVIPNLIQTGLWSATQTKRWPTSSPRAASAWGWAAATTPARWKASARRCSTPRRTARCSRSSCSFCSPASTSRNSSSRGSSTNARRRS